MDHAIKQGQRALAFILKQSFERSLFSSSQLILLYAFRMLWHVMRMKVTRKKMKLQTFFLFVIVKCA